ncbi:MAG: xylulokinase [Planctomycetota bacterium]
MTRASSNAARRLFLGVDIGTSSAKALLLDARGHVAAQADAGYPLQTPCPGWTEQEPEDWWRGTLRAVRAVLRAARARGGDVAGIGLAGQMHGSVFLDASHRVLRPALLWNDQRTSAECDEIVERAGGARALTRFVNNAALTGFTAPKILWLRRHEPRRFAKLARVLLPKDYVRWRLTNEFASDVSDASGTLLLDIARRTWCRPLIDRLGLDKALFPPLLESCEIAGVLTTPAARALGLTAGTPVVAGAGDQPAAAVGMGIVAPGLSSATIGTSGVVFAATRAMAPNADGVLQSFCHAVPQAWCVFGCMLAAGGALEWARRVLYHDDADSRVFDRMIADAARSPAASDAPLFLPYLDGERCPHPDPAARAAWVGLARHHDRPALARAVLEGITFGMADQVRLLRELGLRVGEVRCAGGGARSEFWLRLQANAYNAVATTVNTEHASALGAAILAGVGAREWRSVGEACRLVVRITKRIRPTTTQVACSRARHDKYRALYVSVARVFAITRARQRRARTNRSHKKARPPRRR